MAPWQRGDYRTEQYRIRRHGHCRESHPGIDVGFTTELDVIPDKERILARAFGFACQF